MKIKLASILLFLIPFYTLTAQIEFCSGNKGTPVVLETFGNAGEPIDKNSIGKTSYKYYENELPKEGGYTISNKLNWEPYWFDTKDHTKRDKDGRALIINVHEENEGAFFERKIEGLCSGTTYEFSAWILNLADSDKSPCTAEIGALGGLPVNVEFEIWDETNTEILKNAGTGQIFSSSSPKWKQYGLTFQTVTGQENIILKIVNPYQGGCGNDMAIDDIQFVSCGDKTTIVKNDGDFELEFCGIGPSGYTIESKTDKSLLKKHFYRWEQSTDSINFNKIPGETNILKVPDSLTAGDYFFRVKVAESAGGLENPYCNSISELFKLHINEYPEQPVVENRKDFCAGESVKIAVKSPDVGTEINWYDQPEGGKLLGESESYSPGVLESGTHTFYAEAKFISTGCITSKRTPVKVFVHELLPELKADQFIRKCKYDVVTLDSEVENVIYNWNTGETTKSIEVEKEGTYSVTINAENNDLCTLSRKFVVENIKGPHITRILNKDDNLTVITDETGTFEYSINGGETFKESNVFEDIKNGRYKFVVKRVDSCDVKGPAFNFTKLN